MRLTLAALLCAALTASPALAHDHHGDHPMPPPPPSADMPPPPPGYGVPYGYPADPGAYRDYAGPMIMVPVLRSKPCPEVVEEWVEEVVPVRRRVIPPRARVAPHRRAPLNAKRVPLNDKRVRVAPSKRIPY